jgi:polyisoprenoid-binding protein YceI
MDREFTSRRRADKETSKYLKGFKMKTKTRVLAVIMLVFAAASAQAATWVVDAAHTNVQFSVKHMMVSTVRGSFGAFSGTATFDEKAPSDVAFEGTIDATTVNTNNERRDGHLKSPDFFDVATYPTITFKSTKSQNLSPGNYLLTGDLTMRGVKKEVALTVAGFTDFIKGGKGETRTGATLSTIVNRKDFGLMWNKALEAGGVTVGDSVKINIDVELQKPAEASGQ